MKFATRILLLFAVALIVTDCFVIAFLGHQEQPPAGPPVVMEVLDPSLQQYAPAWQAEIGRRFPRAVGVLCHGGNFIGNEWIVSAKNFERYTTAQQVIRYEQARYPDRTIVFLACNPGHLDLGIRGVYFATDSVWCVPDRALGEKPEDAGKMLDTGYEPTLSRWVADPNVLGNIYEFVQD